MYEIGTIGLWETLPETAAAICDHDTLKLEALLQGVLEPDERILALLSKCPARAEDHGVNIEIRGKQVRIIES